MRARILLFSAFLFIPQIARAQVEGALPDAPSPMEAATSPTRAPAFAPSLLPVGSAPEDPAFDGFQYPTDFEAEDARLEFDGPADSVGMGSLGGRHRQHDTAGLHIDLDADIAAMDRPAYTDGDERYHWKGLLWQSFAFFGVENGFRLMSDPFFRHLTADKPFWRDYLSSMKQWNMGRWNDGDDFLVAYIGHPMQGAVTEFIEIQNDPHARGLRVGKDRAYWKSIFHAFLWNTIYSTDQKIGPLGEAALGSEGGYTYVIGCPALCTTYNPATDKVTNNTGWVKLVSTPVVGTAWTLGEDLLDRFVSDPIQEHFGYDRAFPKIVRGALNPSRTMANFLRWRKPWYRDYNEDSRDLFVTRRFNPLPIDEEAIRAAPRFELFPHLNAISLPVNTASCSHCRQLATGVGVEFSSRLSKRVDFDSDLNYQPNASPLPSDRAGGNIVLGTFGIRSGFQSQRYSLKGSLRPGFLSYSRAYETSPVKNGPAPDLGRITHFTTALALTGDYVLYRHLALRAVVGNTAVRYRESYLAPPTPSKEPYLNWLSRQFFLTNENWTWSAGPVLRF